MKQSITAPLWSLFVFPGSGHFILKKPVAGSVIVVIVFAALAVVMTKVFERANQIAEQIVLGEVAFDLMSIMDMVSAQSLLNESPVLDTAWTVLIVLWIIAALDAFRLGRIKDREDQQKTIA